MGEMKDVAGRMNVILQAVGILLVTAILSLGCNARVEGCLDVEASNFDFTADKDDRSLCNYPSLLLSVAYQWTDTVSFSKNTIYTNDLGQVLSFDDVYVLVSQFALNGKNLGPLSVVDRVEWYLNDSSNPNDIEAIDDFTFVDNSKFTFTLGEWRKTDIVDRLDFYVGVPDTLTPTDPDSLPKDHVLRESRTHYDKQAAQFATARFIVATDTADLDVLDTFVVSSGPLLYSFPLNMDLVQGENDVVRIAIDFHTIFGDVDLTQDSTSIAQELANNLKEAILDNNM